MHIVAPRYAEASETKRSHRAVSMKRWLTVVVLALSLLMVTSCTGVEEGRPASQVEEDRVKAALNDRSFRQFEPSVNASPRKGVILDFFGGVSLWAQYAEGEYAVNEWEISASDYSVEKHGDVSEITIHPIDPRAVQGLPTECDDCIEPAGVSISIRNVLEEEGISFKLNFPAGTLPPPLPVFDSWTEFEEDEYME